MREVAKQYEADVCAVSRGIRQSHEKVQSCAPPRSVGLRVAPPLLQAQDLERNLSLLGRSLDSAAAWERRQGVDICPRFAENEKEAVAAEQAVAEAGEAAAQEAAHKEQSASRSRPLSEHELAQRVHRAASLARIAAVAAARNSAALIADFPAIPCITSGELAITLSLPKGAISSPAALLKLRRKLPCCVVEGTHDQPLLQVTLTAGTKSQGLQVLVCRHRCEGHRGTLAQGVGVGGGDTDERAAHAVTVLPHHAELLARALDTILLTSSSTKGNSGSERDGGGEVAGGERGSHDGNGGGGYIYLVRYTPAAGLGADEGGMGEGGVRRSQYSLFDKSAWGESGLQGEWVCGPQAAGILHVSGANPQPRFYRTSLRWGIRWGGKKEAPKEDKREARERLGRKEMHVWRMSETPDYAMVFINVVDYYDSSRVYPDAQVVLSVPGRGDVIAEGCGTSLRAVKIPVGKAVGMVALAERLGGEGVWERTMDIRVRGLARYFLASVTPGGSVVDVARGAEGMGEGGDGERVGRVTLSYATPVLITCAMRMHAPVLVRVLVRKPGGGGGEGESWSAVAENGGGGAGEEDVAGARVFLEGDANYDFGEGVGSQAECGAKLLNIRAPARYNRLLLLLSARAVAHSPAQASHARPASATALDAAGPSSHRMVIKKVTAAHRSQEMEFPRELTPADWPAQGPLVLTVWMDALRLQVLRPHVHDGCDSLR